jgi:hypothetical protein
VRWAWRPQEGPQQALVVRLRSFAVKLSWIAWLHQAASCERRSCGRTRSRPVPYIAAGPISGSGKCGAGGATDLLNTMEFKSWDKLS